MGEIFQRVAASLLCATLFCLMTVKMLGAMQQSGYKNSTFLRWLEKRENMLFNRLCVLALCLALVSAVTSLCFCFLPLQAALLISALPFLILLLAYLYAEHTRALKVAIVKTGRFQRSSIPQILSNSSSVRVLRFLPLILRHSIYFHPSALVALICTAKSLPASSANPVRNIFDLLSDIKMIC